MGSRDHRPGDAENLIEWEHFRPIYTAMDVPGNLIELKPEKRLINPFIASASW